MFWAYNFCLYFKYIKKMCIAFLVIYDDIMWENLSISPF